MTDVVHLEDPILCFVRPPWAYFTTAPLKEQSGDDWDDRPYEHNAGDPYSQEGHTITVVAFDGDFTAPSPIFWNSPWSVNDINSGAIAWLRFPEFGPSKAIIPAGTPLSRFIGLVELAGGSVYLRHMEKVDDSNT